MYAQFEQREINRLQLSVQENLRLMTASETRFKIFNGFAYASLLLGVEWGVAVSVLACVNEARLYSRAIRQKKADTKILHRFSLTY